MKHESETNTYDDPIMKNTKDTIIKHYSTFLKPLVKNSQTIQKNSINFIPLAKRNYFQNRRMEEERQGNKKKQEENTRNKYVIQFPVRLL